MISRTHPNRFPLFLFYMAVLGIMIGLNLLTPFWADDWWRASEWQEFSKIFARIDEEYHNWGGRVGVLFLTYMGLLKYPGSALVFAVVNGFMFCLLIAAIFRAAIGRFPRSQNADVLTLFGIFLMLWFLTQSFGEVVLWKTGAIAYLWVMVFNILLATPYVELLVNKKSAENHWSKLFLLPIGAFVLATGLENVSVSMVIFMAVVLGYRSLIGATPPLWYWLLGLAYLIGTIVLLIAPGNFVRMAEQSSDISFYQRFNQLVEVIWHHFSQELPVFFLVIGLFCILIYSQLRFNSIRLWLWTLLAVLFSFAMVGAPEVNFQYRTAFAAEIAVIVAITVLIRPLCQLIVERILFWIPASVILILVWAMDFLLIIEQNTALKQQLQRREVLFTHYQQHQFAHIYVPAIKIPGIAELKTDETQGRFFMRDIRNDTKQNEWLNSSFAKFFGFDSALRIPQPYLIFLPELLNNPDWMVHVNRNNRLLISRWEQWGFKRFHAIYLITAKSQCGKPFSVKIPDSTKKVLASVNVQLVNRLGFKNESLCVSRLAIGNHLREKLKGKKVIEKGTRDDFLTLHLSGNEQLAINLQQYEPLAKLPQFMQFRFEPIKKWRACRLPRDPKATTQAFFCSVASSDESPKGILTYGPYYPIAPGAYRVSIQYQSRGAAGNWDQVVQYQDSQNYLSQLLLPDSRGKTRTENYDFYVDKPGGKLEVRSYYNGVGDLSLYSIQLYRID